MFYLPYVAFKFVGIFSTLGIPTPIQFTFNVILLLITGTTAVPLFYYRMDAILPSEHILNTRFLRYSVYTGVYVVAPIIPIPTIYFAVAYEDQKTLKQRLFHSYFVYYEDFLSDDILAADIDGSNPLAMSIVVAMIFACISGILLVSTCCYVIWKLTSKMSKTGSNRYKAQQRHLFMALVIMVSIFLLVVVFIVPGIVALLIFRSYRTDVMQVLLCLGTMSISTGMLAYLLTYRPYRRFLLCRFFKRLDVPSSVSGPSRVFILTKVVEKLTHH